MKVSQSFLDECGLRLQFKREENVYFGGSARAVGTGYHKALELYYLERLEIQETGGVMNPLSLDSLVSAAIDEFDHVSNGGISHPSEENKEWGGFTWSKAIPDRESAHEAIELMVRAYFNEGHMWPEDWEIVAVEHRFDLPWYNDHRRTGAADLILRDPNGWIVVDDHKTAGRRWNTGKEKPRKNPQACWYGWAAQEMFPGAPGYRVVFSIMTYKGVFERRISDPTPDHIAAAARLLSASAEQYLMTREAGLDMPANPSSTLCSPAFCDFWDRCPHGSVLD